MRGRRLRDFKPARFFQPDRYLTMPSSGQPGARAGPGQAGTGIKLAANQPTFAVLVRKDRLQESWSSGPNGMRHISRAWESCWTPLNGNLTHTQRQVCYGGAQASR